MDNVKVSICVPVYNCEKYLPYFLDSALLQKFEDYEIILADNKSEDASFNILKTYEEKFPEKIHVYQVDEHGGPGKGRNLAFEKSSGDYIYWCDADDLLHPDALKFLYEEAEKYDADLVCGSPMRVEESNGEIFKIFAYAPKKNIQANNEMAIQSGVEFWLRLIKRTLVEEVGLIPDYENIVFDDVRYITVLQSYAKNIRFYNFPVYYWFKHDITLSSVPKKEVCEDSVAASKYVLENAKTEYIEAVQHHLCRRNFYNLDQRWQFFDVFVNSIHEDSKWFYNNTSLKRDKKLFETLRWADGLSDIHFPNIVYVDGISETPTEERLKELQEKVFHDGCEIVVLSEENCDINENEYVKRAYEKGDKEFVAKYFALKKIYENGGVFIHKNIRILNYFSYLKYQNAFFALIDKTTYSDWIFGSPAQNEAIAAILKTYSDGWDKKREYMPLSERISIILTAKYGIPLDGKGRPWKKIVSTIPPHLSVVDNSFGDIARHCAFEHDFSESAGSEDFVTLPRTTLRLLMDNCRPSGGWKSSREIALEKELDGIKNSNLGKIMYKIRRIGDGRHGLSFKKIFHGLLKIRAKIRRKR